MSNDLLPRAAARPLAARLRAFTIAATPEQVALAASLFWLLSANGPFFAAALQDRLGSAGGWGFALALGVMLACLQALLLLLVASRWTLKPLLAVLFISTGMATWFMSRYGVYLDPTMMRNVLRTDTAEARELVSWALVPHLLLHAALPLALLSRVRLVRRPLLRAAAVRAGWFVALLGLAVATLLSVFQPMSSLMRNQKALRYQITPANYVWSLGNVLVADARGAAKPRQSIGEDAAPGPSWAQRTRPRLVVMVVGETARAANWGLNGYERQTTPELAQLPVVNFREVRSCGTNTEVSVPCLFAPIGRRDYDEARIRGSESLLHVVARAGVDVRWIDNQSGCKGVCDGLPSEDAATAAPPALCRDGHCLDEALLAGLAQRLDAARGTQLLVLHMLGNHGPSYFRRYPPAFARFQPECRQDDLPRCSREEIVNAYDNALLYTDHVLATLVRQLQARADRLDTALLYVSDHGESLGEHRLYLHGVPYPIAPTEQTRVPMVMWASAGFAQGAGLDLGCLQRRAQQPASHDHVFHSLLALLDVRTRLYEPDWDLTAGCRAAPAPATP